MTDGIQRAMTRHIRCAWEIYAVTERGMSAGEALRVFDNWMDSVGESAVRKAGESDVGS
ncbi:hypothetical protein [Microbacterium sp. ProA8]|uniref:hypothetical protein n=1 Tax=Microbacterium chionoecetis TaxID=3153754 RepID=UPI0032651382